MLTFELLLIFCVFVGMAYRYGKTVGQHEILDQIGGDKK